MQSKIVAVRIAWGAGSLPDFTAKRLQNLAQEPVGFEAGVER